MVYNKMIAFYLQTININSNNFLFINKIYIILECQKSYLFQILC